MNDTFAEEEGCGSGVATHGAVDDGGMGEGAVKSMGDVFGVGV